MTILLITLFITNLLLFLGIGLLWLLVKFLAKYKQIRIKYRRFRHATYILCGLWTLTAFYGYLFGRWHYEVKEWTYIDERLPKGFDGYKIVHISDLHLENFNDKPSFVDTLVNAINKLDADLICFTGDLVSFNSDGLKPFLSSLANLKAKDGVISILGNHDYSVYDRSLDSLQKRSDRQRLIDMEREQLKWRLLTNEHTIIYHNTDSIAIVGVENQACGPHQKVREGRLDIAMQGTQGLFTILLSHDPSHWDAEVVGKTDIPLTLSGHTHAMQFKVFGWTPCRWFYKRSDGAYSEGKQQIYVNIGLGELMPFRIGATPEITLITLHNK